MASAVDFTIFSVTTAVGSMQKAAVIARARRFGLSLKCSAAACLTPTRAEAEKDNEHFDGKTTE